MEALHFVIILVFVVVTIGLIADQIKCGNFLRAFKNYGIGDHCLLMLPNGKTEEVEIRAFDFDHDRVIVRKVGQDKNWIVSNKYFLEYAKEIEK